MLEVIAGNIFLTTTKVNSCTIRAITPQTTISTSPTLCETALARGIANPSKAPQKLYAAARFPSEIRANSR
jgi:hypothetical protein